MNIVHLQTEFDSVYLVNGEFSEALRALPLSNQPIYITLLPLKASLLPYTVKVVEGISQNNRDLAISYSLPQDTYMLTFKPRFNYVYTPSGVALRNPSVDMSKNMAVRCFFHVKNGEISKARQLMTVDLNNALDDKNLSAFFSDYIDAIDNAYFSAYKNAVILIDKNKMGYLFEITYRQGLIDNIMQMDI